MSHNPNCNVDLDSPCTGGAVDEDGEPGPCDSCVAEREYWARYFKGHGPKRSTCTGCGEVKVVDESGCCSKACQDDSLRDAGRGHLVRH